jgi:hypothetical protein
MTGFSEDKVLIAPFNREYSPPSTSIFKKSIDLRATILRAASLQYYAELLNRISAPDNLKIW